MRARSGRGRAVQRLVRERAYQGGFLIGVALMAAVDEIVFHQILSWHHFYDRSTPAIGLLSDGLLHAVEVVALVAGSFLLLDARRRSSLRASVAVAGGLTGAGLFQLWDGVVDHKLLRVHQVRYEVDLLPYDVAWVASGALLLVAGIVLSMRVRRGA